MASTLPPDLFDQTTLVSLAATVGILAVALTLSRRVLPASTPTRLRLLFVWHAFDALIHFCLEGSFLYLCFFSAAPAAALPAAGAGGIPVFPDPYNYLGGPVAAGFPEGKAVVHGAQAGGDNPFAQLWMVYARADRRWAGVDLGVVSLELLTVFVVGPMACLVCYDIAKRNPRANILMIVLATAELYGGFMTFCPEWLTGNVNLDGSNFMYMWVYLVFFNMLWVFIPLFAIYVASEDILNAFTFRNSTLRVKKAN